MQLERPIVVLDLETTGTWIEKDRIIEVALIRREPDQTQSTYRRYVNPGIPIPAVVTEITGIRDQDVMEAPLFKDIAREVLDFLKGAELAGFNVERFDLPLLAREMNDAGQKFEWKHRKVYDAQKIFHLNEKRDLSAAYRFYCDKDLENAHSAMADTEATLEILESQVREYGGDSENIDVLQQFSYKLTADFYDEQRKFRWWNGKLYMTFGKYAFRYSLPEVVGMDRGYLEWILKANFHDDVKVLVEDALNGKFPDAPDR